MADDLDGIREPFGAAVHGGDLVADFAGALGEAAMSGTEVEQRLARIDVLGE